MSENISISGVVQGYDRKAIPNIKVSVYRDTQFLSQDYTNNEEGKYILSVPPGSPITVRFDTHWSLTNAKEWHPSILTNIDAKENIVLPNRFLLRVGHGESETAFIDALTAYQFCLMWTRIDQDSEYAKIASARLSPMKLIPELMEIQQMLIKFFRKLAESS